MKSCPTCNRSFDDAFSFCLVDGTVLSAPYDPEATEFIQSEQTIDPASIEALHPASRPTDPTNSLQPTITAPGPRPLNQHDKQYQPQVSRSSKTWLAPGIGALLGILLATMITVIIIRVGTDNEVVNPSQAKNPNANAASTVAPGSAINETGETSSACGYRLGSALFNRWVQTGGKNGRFGCPITDQSEAPTSPQGTTGQWVKFSGGDGAFIIQLGSGPFSGRIFDVHGCMFKLYASQGGTGSWLGFPIGNEYEIPTGAKQDFEGGYIDWDSKTAVCRTHEN